MRFVSFRWFRRFRSLFVWIGLWNLTRNDAVDARSPPWNERGVDGCHRCETRRGGENVGIGA